MIKKLLFILFCINAQAAAYAITCAPGYYISNDECIKPPAGTYSPGGTSTGYYECDWDRYTNEDQSACIKCPPEYPSAKYRSQSINDCFRVCMGGTYMAKTTDTKCTEVGPGFYAPLHIYIYGRDATIDGTLHQCPDGTRTLGRIGYSADDESDCAHILHIGDESLRVVGKKKTAHALAARIDGKTYYAQMSEAPHTIADGATTKLRIGIDGVGYYVFDDTIVTREPYPWESIDYDWSKSGKFTYDTAANTWEITFDDSIWTGTAKCIDKDCYCKMASPAVTDWIYRTTRGDCQTSCALECGWGYGQSPTHRKNLIRTIDE